MPPAERGLSGCWCGAIVIRVQLGSSSHHHIIEQHRSSSSSWPLLVRVQHRLSSSEYNSGHRHRRSHVAIRVQHRSSFSETQVNIIGTAVTPSTKSFPSPSVSFSKTSPYSRILVIIYWCQHQYLVLKTHIYKCVSNSSQQVKCNHGFESCPKKLQRVHYLLKV